jgi:DNA polymerase-3 subunit epsilon
VRLPALPTRRSGLGAEAAAYVHAELSRRSTPWSEARWCAVDFELTGLDPRLDQVVSFGAIPIDGGRVQLGRAVSGLVRPTRESGEAAIHVHGIRAVDLSDAPTLADAVGGLIQTLTGRGLVLHVAAIDRPFLKRALRHLGVRLRGPVVDTEVLGRLWLYEREGHLRRHLGLGELAAALGLPLERPHDALGDALTTAQIFIALAAHMSARQVETVGSLSTADERLDAVRMFQHHSPR